MFCCQRSQENYFPSKKPVVIPVGVSDKFELTMSISEALEMMKPFDLIAFRRFKAGHVAMGQKLFLGNGDWTHVGIVVTIDVFPIKNGIPGKKYLWECTRAALHDDFIPDIETGEVKNSVLLRDLEKVLIHYKGYRAFFRLKNNPWDHMENDATYTKLVRQIIIRLKKLIGRLPFCTRYTAIKSLLPTVYTKMIRKIIDEREQIKEGLYFPSLPDHLPKSLFCSALVVLVLQAIGVFPFDYDPLKVAAVELFGYSNDGYDLHNHFLRPIRME